MLNLKNPLNLTIVILVLILVVLGLYWLYKTYFGENFNDHAMEKSSDEYTLVLFYAPWCPHCTTYKPEFELLGESLKLGNIKVNILTINMEDQAELNSDFKSRFIQGVGNIEGYPTVALFKNGKKLTEYNGERNKEGLSNFLEKFAHSL